MAIITTKMTDRVFAGLLLSDDAVRFSGTRVSVAAAARPAVAAIREAAVSERPTQAPAAAVAKATPRGAYATANVAGAGNQLFGQQKTQLHTMWALRGLDPWSDPA